MTTQHLGGKVALIQGGSRGIGAAIVKRLAAEGAAVAFTYVSSTAKAEELQNSITANGGKALAIKADSADAAAIRHAVSSTVEAFGRLDILVNNAGVLAVAPLEDGLAIDAPQFVVLVAGVDELLDACFGELDEQGPGGAVGGREELAADA